MIEAAYRTDAWQARHRALKYLSKEYNIFDCIINKISFIKNPTYKVFFHQQHNYCYVLILKNSIHHFILNCFYYIAMNYIMRGLYYPVAVFILYVL